MNVILLEKVRNLGDLGEQVSVSAGFARNYLYPNEIAIPASEDNVKHFESRRAELEKHAAEEKAAAEAKAAKIQAMSVTLAVKSGEEGKLFGSLGPRDIALAITKAGVEVEKRSVAMPTGPIRQTGEYDIEIYLHTDVVATVKITVVGE